MKSLKAFERKIILYALVGTLLFGLIHYYSQELFPFFNQKYYTSLHIILEFFSISISIAIFTYGWKVFSYSKSSRLLFLSFIFVTIGILDLIHTLTFKNMPFFISEGAVHKSIWFWLISRLTGSIMVIVVFLLPEKRLKKDPRVLLTFITFFYIYIVSFLIFHFEDRLPAVVIEGLGTTPLKKGIEYFVSFLYLISMLLNFIVYKRSKKPAALYIFLSFYFLLISELIFTIYRDIHDIDNITGHLFKVIGYFFIMKGFYFSAISEDKIAEEKINRARQELDEIIREQQGIIFKFKKHGNDFIHTLCNGELLYKLGIDPIEVRKRKLEELIPESADFLLYHYQLAWNSGQKVTFEMDIKDVSMLISLKPMIDDGHVTEVIGSATDISRLRHMEDMIQSTEKLGVLGELAAGIAHEVRNPLTTLKGFLQLIRNDADQQNQTYIKLMLEEVDRIEQITNEFMAVAKPQALLYRPENITTIIHQVVALLQPQAILQDVQINVNETGQTLPVFCEKNHLKQVFMNLMKNAFEAMPNGGTLNITITPQNHEYMNISFNDTGSGIPEDALKKIGEPFFTLKEKGNGLGLMMCKKIIQQHRGQIEVESKLNKGTTFKITLPIYQELD
ncbi:MASE3 domain-containing protein [Neobacillus sp. LXY-4]|uniref:MASE3 domain-containing protein n=1 Tax=Neobacillus sp. LXY-4 TaxID=3379826 RepID=UPI003EDE907D